MKIIYQEVNFIYMQENYLAHGCNTHGVMGAGVAKQIRSAFPEAYKEYHILCEQNNPDDLLGKIQIVESKNKFIINCFTQKNYGTNTIQLDYNALRSCFKNINIEAKKRNFDRVGFPKIGAGLAGGNWDWIAEILEEESTNFQPIVSIISK